MNVRRNGQRIELLELVGGYLQGCEVDGNLNTQMT